MNKEEILKKLQAGELSVEEAGKQLAEIDAQEGPVLQSQREGRHQRLWPAADARHALRRAMDPPARLRRRAEGVHEGERRQAEAEGEGVARSRMLVREV